MRALRAELSATTSGSFAASQTPISCPAGYLQFRVCVVVDVVPNTVTHRNTILTPLIARARPRPTNRCNLEPTARCSCNGRHCSCGGLVQAPPACGGCCNLLGCSRESEEPDDRLARVSHQRWFHQGEQLQQGTLVLSYRLPLPAASSAPRVALAKVPQQRDPGDLRLSADAWCKVQCRGGHFIAEDPAVFDAPFFSVTAKEAASMDPMQRWTLEASFHAFENGS